MDKTKRMSQNARSSFDKMIYNVVDDMLEPQIFDQCVNQALFEKY